MNPIQTVLVLALVLGLASAACFGTGQSWGSAADKQKASAYLTDVCNQLAGSYQASTIKSQCRDGNDNTRYNFSVKHISGGERTLGQQECIDGLNKEIINCPRGGRTSYSNWEYTSDPNAGLCN
ncbi:hypothetical protein VP01_1678g1 [Puccinia sorghi]|uniref:Uncharacterized protein n=1 Tax=Puccinia sorghi TaxID=27349 RepID=A0A0L6VG26_9BASI|nr:hypothetical protein VP01_1678g1 [Puccinia sorghi]